MSLKKQTVSGVKWQLFSSFLQKTISVGTIVVLARILSPNIFGLFALAFIAIDALGLFKSMGFDTALIQRKDGFEKAANTASIVIPITGIILYSILFLSAPSFGVFLNNADIVNVIRILGITFVFSCLSRVPTAILERNLKFKEISLVEIYATIVYSISAIALAITGHGVWSLVIAYIVRTFFQNILFWSYSQWRPRFEFDLNIAIEMFNFGKFLLLCSIIWFLKMNLDNFLVGKILGVTALGLYAIAFNISNFAAEYLAGKVYRVTYPLYSKLQDSKNDLMHASMKILKHVSLIAVPFGICLFLLSGDFLALVYGEKWLEATQVLMILSWGGIFSSLSSAIGGVFLVCGKPQLGFLIMSLQVIIFLVFIVPMAKIFGINGVGIIVSLSNFITFIITLVWLKRILSFRLSQIYSCLKPSIISSFMMGVGIIFIRKFLFNWDRFFIFHYNFIILIIFAIIIYLFILFLTDRDIFQELKELIFK